MRTVAIVGIVVVALIVAPATAQAQTFTVLHTFTGGQDGANPLAGLTMDQSGNFYGTASLGGAGFGTVFRLAHRGSGWVLSPLYIFRGMPDGAFPSARVIIAPDGTLYGTTFYGGIRGQGCFQGGPQQCGTIFRLRPPASACAAVSCPWTETRIYEFNTYPSLFWPDFGDLAFDSAGNIYGTAVQGGPAPNNDGGVFRLSPSGGGWTETDLYHFGVMGHAPMGSVVFDNTGTLFGTTYGNPGFPDSPYGTVYSLTHSGSNWTFTELYVFQNGSDGARPRSDLTMDAPGNLYGTSSTGGAGGGGTAWELGPSDGGWTFQLLYSFPGPGKGPFGPLTMDAASNLYGTTLGGGAFGEGSVFELSPSQGSWVYRSLHDFTGGNDGRAPYGRLVFDENGNLYGTAEWGGSSDYGTIWEITP